MSGRGLICSSAGQTSCAVHRRPTVLGAVTQLVTYRARLIDCTGVTLGPLPYAGSCVASP